MRRYEPCQIKFAFDVPVDSPLSWSEYFGYEDEFDMLDCFCKKHLVSNTLSFCKTDSSGAKLTVVFETACMPSEFEKDYRLAVSVLEKLNDFPELNRCQVKLNSMLETLDDNGVTIYEDEPASKVFEEFNLLEYGFSSYLERISNAKK